MTRRPTASPAPDDAEPAALTPPAAGPFVGTFELGVGPEAVELGAQEATLQQALGLGAVVTGPDAPALPLDPLEPTPVSRLGEAPAPVTPTISDGLRRLAGPDPARARAALAAALRGEPYDPRELPGARALLLGLARVVVAHGVEPDQLLDAVIAAMLE